MGKGNKITLLQKTKTNENFLIKNLRKFYYWFLTKTQTQVYLKIPLVQVFMINP